MRFSLSDIEHGVLRGIPFVCIDNTEPTILFFFRESQTHAHIEKEEV